VKYAIVAILAGHGINLFSEHLAQLTNRKAFVRGQAFATVPVNKTVNVLSHFGYHVRIENDGITIES
jgi:hypothetical protein